MSRKTAVTTADLFSPLFPYSFPPFQETSAEKIHFCHPPTLSNQVITCERLNGVFFRNFLFFFFSSLRACQSIRENRVCANTRRNRRRRGGSCQYQSPLSRQLFPPPFSTSTSEEMEKGGEPSFLSPLYHLFFPIWEMRARRGRDRSNFHLKEEGESAVGVLSERHYGVVKRRVQNSTNLWLPKKP